MASAFKLNVPVNGGGNVEYFSDCSQYVVVAASATTSQVSVSGKCLGDYLDHIIINPGTTAQGLVSILDGTTVIASCPAAVTAGTYFYPVQVDIGLPASPPRASTSRPALTLL